MDKPITKPTVELLHFTPLAISDQAIGQCWGKGGFTGDKLKERMNRVANKFKHASTIEHMSYNFYISDISRALLQELARHRMSSFSVKSTRYTLKELKDEKQFNSFPEESDRASNYLVWTGNHNIDITTFFALEDLRVLLNQGISNDIAKYALPEAYKTELVWTVNARSLQNFLGLRTNKSALWEIRNLAYEIFEQIPQDHKFLFENNIYHEKEIDVQN